VCVEWGRLCHGTMAQWTVYVCFGTNRKLICDFLLVINTNLAHIFHRFRDKAFHRSQIAIQLPLSCLTHTGTISVKFYLNVNRWPV